MIRFAAVICTIVWLLVFSTGVVRGAERSREQPQTIRIAFASPVTTMAPIWIASEIGAYQRLHDDSSEPVLLVRDSKG